MFYYLYSHGVLRIVFTVCSRNRPCINLCVTLRHSDSLRLKKYRNRRGVEKYTQSDDQIIFYFKTLNSFPTLINAAIALSR